MQKIKVLTPFFDSQSNEYVKVGDELEVSAARAADLARNHLAEAVDAPAKTAPGPKEARTDGPKETKTDKGAEDAKPSKPAAKQPAKR